MSGETKTLSDLKEIVAGTPAATAEAAIKLEPKRDAQGRSYATGRRKNAIARVWIKPGKGQFTINDHPASKYFARPVLRMLITQPFLWLIVISNSMSSARSWAVACPARPGRCAMASAVRSAIMNPICAPS